MKEAFKEAIIELLKTAFSSLGHWITGASYSLALVGGTISVLLYVAGWSKGMRCTGVLLVAHVILKTIFG